MKQAKHRKFLRRFLPLVLLSVGTAFDAGVLFASSPTSQQSDEEQRRPFVEAERLIRLAMEVPIEPARVFDAWTDATQLVEWFSHWAEITVTEGGEYRIGWNEYEAVWEGTYLEVNRPELLMFTWHPPAEIFPAGAYPTTVRITFEDLDGTTRMVLEQSGFRGTEEMESSLETWRSYLYILRAFLLQPRPSTGRQS